MDEKTGRYEKEVEGAGTAGEKGLAEAPYKAGKPLGVVNRAEGRLTKEMSLIISGWLKSPSCHHCDD